MSHIGTPEGNRILARVLVDTWTDPNFKQRLLLNPDKVLKEVGITILPGTRVKIKRGSGTVQFQVPPEYVIRQVDPSDESPRRISRKTFAIPNGIQIKKKLIKKPRYVLPLPKKPPEWAFEVTSNLSNLHLNDRPNSSLFSLTTLFAVNSFSSAWINVGSEIFVSPQSPERLIEIINNINRMFLIFCL